MQWLEVAQADETHRAAVHRLGRIERRRAVHLAAEPKLGVSIGLDDAGLGFAEAREHFLRVIADG